jgi:glycerol 3-phosphatase-2
VRGERLGACADPLSRHYDAALCDLDGVLYLGEEPVPHAAESVGGARADGMRFAFVTNNASRRPHVVAQRLTALDIPAEPAEVVTSGQAAGRLLAAQVPPGSAVLVLGTEALADEVTGAGMRPVRTVVEAGQFGPAAVVQGLAPQTSWSDLAEAAVAIRGGAIWIVGNTDATLPSPRGPLPGNGAFVAALRLAVRAEPLVAGKPDPALHHESVERVGAERPLVVGDRLDTDVLGAVRGGADSLLVLTGVTDLEELLRAPAGSRPTYVSSDLRGVRHPHPQVEVEGESARCGAATARVHDGQLRVDSPGDGEDPDDGIRALAALAWDRADRGLPTGLQTGLQTG